MPLIRYKCNLCDNYIEKIIMNTKDIRGAVPCECGGFLERQLSAPSSSSEQMVDTPMAVKPVYFNRDRYEWNKSNGDKIIRDIQEKEFLNKEKK